MAEGSVDTQENASPAPGKGANGSSGVGDFEDQWGLALPEVYKLAVKFFKGKMLMHSEAGPGRVLSVKLKPTNVNLHCMHAVRCSVKIINYRHCKIKIL